MKTHPTADEVYRQVTAAHPSVSKATVYRNLNILAQRYAFQASETGAGGLDVNFDLYGYLKPSPAAPREPARAP